ncbi:HK97 family phage prohead protease [Mycobacterium kansasii]|uniref:HK97 family phage prohead protease n=1 Tax=Mycobacterium kansasii TaxID=1768 RepID=UPI000CDD7FB9|nr:HK97 family phage prohead protease [Mycobacterium kansasii]POY04859.1 HK97 family phage prohead protease [Mycobacterium kansasii]POY29129.1 HK97 family phage prohead protease [Mycobacterium kansasii]POY34235.1 HK97 family phage prohead protease [Mycobacterium kansasii]
MSICYRNAELTPGEGRTVYGTVVPYGEEITVRDFDGEYRERFAPGAFERSIRERGHKLKLLVSHTSITRYPVGRAVELREERFGLFAAFDIARTKDGDEALDNINAGVVDSFSVGFRPIRDRRENGVVVRVEAALIEVSLTGTPAYPGAEIAGVRSESLVIPRSLAIARLSLLDW